MSLLQEYKQFNYAITENFVILNPFYCKFNILSIYVYMIYPFTSYGINKLDPNPVPGTTRILG